MQAEAYLGRPDRAIADYNAAIRIVPSYAQAYGGRCLAYELKGNKDKVIADCRKV